MGPLSGVKVLELGGIGPGPFCCMLLADMGADVIRVDRTAPADAGFPGADPRFALMRRGCRSIALDLKRKEATEVVRALAKGTDILVEGFRPGVSERLGLGPDDCLALNPRLVYGRMTGWGQDGPLAQVAGHDVNYIGLTGALNTFGPADGPPTPPLNLLGDFGGGALYLAFGIVCALLEARQSGQGQVVDAAIVDGVTHLMTDLFGKLASGRWTLERGANTLDGGTPFYGVYATKDGRFVSIAPIERKFYNTLLELMGLEQRTDQHDRSGWADLRSRLEAAFKTKTQAEWVALLGHTDACCAPVLDLREAMAHPQLGGRGTFVEIDGVMQPAPAPRFSRSAAAVRSGPALPGQHSDEILAEIGYTEAQIAALRSAHALA